MPISTFSPIYSDIAHPFEKCVFLRGAVNFFDFGQTAYNICYYDNNQKIEVIEAKKDKLSWVKTFLRVAALVTVVIPLLMAIGASIYKSVNHFHISNATNELNKIPNDILSYIFYKLGPSILRIATTNKENNQIIEINKPLKEDQMIYKALKKSYFLARELKKSMKADRKTELNDYILRFKGCDYHLAMIAMITALSDPQKALEITNSIEYPMHKMAASAFIAKRLIESNHQTVALKIIKKAINMPKSGDYQKNSIPVLKVLALMELERKNAIELAKDMAENDYCEIGHKVKALTELAKIEAKYDLENAKELLEQAITVSRPSRFLLTGYHNLIKVAAKLDPAKLESIIKASLEKINSMEIVDLKFAIKGHFLNDLFLFNSLQATEILEQIIIENMGDKSLSVHLYSGVFKALKFLSPEKGTKLADFVIKEIVKENVYFRSVFLAGFAEGLVLSNRKKAKGILDLAIKDHGFLSGQLGLDVSIRIAKTLFKFDPISAEKMLDEAVLLLNSINEKDKNNMKTDIAGAFIKMNLQKGIDLANDIKETESTHSDTSKSIQMNCLLNICASKLRPSFSAKLMGDEIWKL